MLDNLRAYLDSGLSDDPFVRLDSIEFREFDGLLVLSVVNYDETEIIKRWLVKATGLQDCNVTDPYGDLRFHDHDHVLALQHTDSRQKLMFSGTPQSPSRAIGELLIAHRRLPQDWIPFERYLNPHVDLVKLLEAGHGQLADGPSFLVKEYAKSLVNEQIRPNVLAPHSAKWWNGKVWVETPSTLATLLIGRAYFVAERFEDAELAANG